MGRHWKIAFCGLGSIGSRHLRNIAGLLAERGDTFSVDWIANKERSVPEEFKNIIDRTFTYQSDIDVDYDIIFITNPTSRHFDSIKKYQWHTKSLFIEKPLFADDSKKITNINMDCIYYIACPVRYKKVIQYVKAHIPTEDVFSAIAICSSYLPEWRKGTDYRKGYSAIKELGGGVSLDLIHELDYLFYLFGMPQKVFNIRDHVSPLELNSDDVSVYIAKLDKAVVQVYLDYYGRSDMRTLTLFCKDDTITVDLLSNTVKYMKTGKKVSFEETRDDFQKRELSYFLDVVEEKAPNSNDMDTAYQTLKYTFGRV